MESFLSLSSWFPHFEKYKYYMVSLNLDFDLDKRNQSFRTSDGYRSIYSIGLPIVSEKNTLNNFYNYADKLSNFESSVVTKNNIIEKVSFDRIKKYISNSGYSANDCMKKYKKDR